MHIVNMLEAKSTRGIALRNLLTGESPVARFGHDRLYQSACKTHLGRAPWISLLPAGRGWRTRGLAMPACTTTTKCWLSPCALSSAAVKARHIWRHSRWPGSRSCAVSSSTGTRLAEPRYVQPSVSPPRSRAVPRDCFSALHEPVCQCLPRPWSRWMARCCAAPSIRPAGSPALHMVSAWGSDARLVLGQIATDAKSNEITAVPKLLANALVEGKPSSRLTRSTVSAPSLSRLLIRAATMPLP